VAARPNLPLKVTERGTASSCSDLVFPVLWLFVQTELYRPTLIVGVGVGLCRKCVPIGKVGEITDFTDITAVKKIFFRLSPKPTDAHP
jgi:hypothetical protein